MKKILALVLACLMLVSVVACGSKDDGALNICLASEPDTLDPALNSAVDGATMLAHLFSGLAKWSQDDDGNLVIVPDCAVALPEGVTNEDGTVTYTYTLKDGLKWSNGDAVTAGDFVFSWNRAASAELGADYGYMFDVVVGYADVAAGTAGAKLAVEATDDKTLVVTISNSLPYWHELTAFPTYFPVHEETVANSAWATEAETYVCNGAYTMASWKHDSVIKLEKNPNYHDAALVTMEKINCNLSDDDNNQLANFKNGDWDFIDSVPVSAIETLKVEHPTEFRILDQIGTYYVCFNVNANILPAGSTLTGVEAEQAKAEIRKAIGLLFDRNNIVKNVSQAGETPASSFVPAGMVNPDNSQFYLSANGGEAANGYVGYYNIDTVAENIAAAKATFEKYGTLPQMLYLYNTNDGHKAIAEYIQGAMANAGLNITLENQEWNTFLNTRKNGEYTIARNGWVADYTDPISFLDMWLTESGNNDVQFGKGAHAELAMYDLDLTALGYDIKVEDGTWAQTYDVLIAKIKAETNPETRYAMMHIAEDMLMDTGCIVPIYYYTDPCMISDSVEGFFANPLGYKYFMYTTFKAE